MRQQNYPLYETDVVGNLKELVNNCAAKYAGKIAFEYRLDGQANEQVTYSQFKSDIESLGTAFYKLGLRNCHIAVLGENSYEWIITYLAVTGGSSVIVPVDRELPPMEMKNIITGSNCRALVFSEKFAATIAELDAEIDQLDKLINMDSPQDAGRVLSFQALLEMGRKAVAAGDRNFIDNPIENEALAAIIYTSGTTGVSKGVMLSQSNIASNVVATAQHTTAYENSVLVLPLHHTFGWTAGVLCMLHIGSRIGVNSSLKNVTRDMMFYKPTQMCLVPLYLETMYKRIWEQAEKQHKIGLLKMLLVISRGLIALGIDMRRRLFTAVLEGFGGRLCLVICGGAPLDAKYVKGFRDFGIQVLNGYGLTECAPIVTANRNDYYRDDSIGLVLPGCQVMIDNPDANGEGELLVKGPNVMLGYYNNPQATAATMAGAWLRTGDIGSIDADGFVYITGRIKNMIKLSSGINIYPEELEMLIMDIPLVKEAIVYGQTVAGKKEPMLFAEVFLDKQFIESHGITDPEQFLHAEIESINGGLPYYKKIGQIIIRPVEFDKTTTRKIKRFKIVH